MRTSQQDDASDERRVEATEAAEQPRFESNQASSRTRPRRSRLIVKDVGQPFSIAMSQSVGQPLSAAESTLVRWMLEHGEPGATQFLPQVDELRVVARCSCGCASIDFTSDKSGSMTIVADFGLPPVDGVPGGVFLFVRGGKLAGLDIYSFDKPITQVPKPEMLVPLPLA